ncbi:MAG: hypothetical protein J6S85_18250 [Methanobrevibacter sp.]|nr:hypothetical protein [Methanobrevibacter sp.]
MDRSYIKELTKMDKSYSYKYLEEKILNANSFEDLNKALEDIELDYEAGNISEEEKETLICIISDREVDLELEGK